MPARAHRRRTLINEKQHTRTLLEKNGMGFAPTGTRIGNHDVKNPTGRFDHTRQHRLDGFRLLHVPWCREKLDAAALPGCESIFKSPVKNCVDRRRLVKAHEVVEVSKLKIAVDQQNAKPSGSKDMRCHGRHRALSHAAASPDDAQQKRR